VRTWDVQRAVESDELVIVEVSASFGVESQDLDIVEGSAHSKKG
jgi:hypothetical protein